MRRFLRKFSLRFSVLGDFFSYLWKNRLWWMIPIVIMLVILSIFIWFTQSSSAVVPFIYALF